MEQQAVRHAEERIRTELLPGLRLESGSLRHPVQARDIPPGWELLGCGNYAAVLAHPELEGLAVKVYAPDREGWEDEVEVYRKLGEHPAYGRCYASGEHEGARYLLLKRLRGVTLYRCLLEGLVIPERAIADVDEALAYAASRGLNPHDVHGKNVMVSDGRGIVVDVSDFLKPEPCSMWRDLKRAYYGLYRPLLSKPDRSLRIPPWMMNGIRLGYRLVRRQSGRRPKGAPTRRSSRGTPPE
ncbi:serine/threonine protein kinase [Paenibacillus sp. D51F]